MLQEISIQQSRDKSGYSSWNYSSAISLYMLKGISLLDACFDYTDNKEILSVGVTELLLVLYSSFRTFLLIKTMVNLYLQPCKFVQNIYMNVWSALALCIIHFLDNSLIYLKFWVFKPPQAIYLHFFFNPVPLGAVCYLNFYVACNKYSKLLFILM